MVPEDDEGESDRASRGSGFRLVLLPTILLGSIFTICVICRYCRKSNDDMVFNQVEEYLSSDAGLLPFFELDQKLGWSASFSSCIRDQRNGCTHSVLSIVRQRVFGILAGYEDQNDHEFVLKYCIHCLTPLKRSAAIDRAYHSTVLTAEFTR